MIKKRGHLACVYLYYILICIITATILSLLQVLIFQIKTTPALLILKSIIILFVADVCSVKWITPKYGAITSYSFNYIILDKIRELNIPNWILYLGGTLFILCFSVFTRLAFSSNAMNNPVLDSDSLISLGPFFGILLLLFLGPFVETLLMQMILIEYLSKITRKFTGKEYIIFAGVVSALLFSIIHPYSIGYMVYSFSAGLLLSFTYIYKRIRYNKRQALFSTYFMHVLVNIPPVLVGIIIATANIQAS